jgi:Pyruvate/2-oxoacid:ferredoxin oxidoreductase delta subunit/flavodoxin
MDTIQIFYFTGTGNSLAIAKDLSKRLNAKLTSIASCIDSPEIVPEGDIVGLVFPVYNSVNDGLPLMVIEFAKKLKKLQAKYIFAVCCSGAGIVPGNQSLGRRLREKGGLLSALYTIRMPFNITPATGVDAQRKMFGKWESQVDSICADVVQKKVVPYGFPRIVTFLLKPLGEHLRSNFISTMQKQCASPDAKTIYELTPLMDKSFTVNDTCDGCGICANVCPAKNIEMKNGKPAWKHHCETCLACYHWCPKNAIANTYGTVQYHHPKISLAEMLEQRGGGIILVNFLDAKNIKHL